MRWRLYTSGPTPAVYGFALSILKNAHDAEDVLQDVYLQVWHGASGYRSHGKAMGWMMTITRNLTLDRAAPAQPCPDAAPRGVAGSARRRPPPLLRRTG